MLDAARSQELDVIVVAIKEEAAPEIDQRGAAAVHWLSLGELSKLIETFKLAGVSRAIMAGQVKHRQIFSSIKPDWRLAKLLLSLRTRNTDALLGAVAKVLGDEGITLVDSTSLLEPMLAAEGVLTRRAPNDSRADQHHLWTRGGASPFALRHRADGCYRRSSLCCGGGDGGHRCNHPARGRDHADAVAGS